ncbi:MAG: efflux RND transporter permease subunit [Pseudomonadota bacterium]
MAGLQDVFVFTQQGNLFGDFEGSREVLIFLQGRDRTRLAATAQELQAALNQGLGNTNIRIQPPVQVSQPELRLVPRQRALAEAGWNSYQVASAVRAVGSGLYVGEYFDGDIRMDIMIRAAGWENPEDMGALPMVSPSGSVYRIEELVDMQRTVGPSQVFRRDGRRTTVVSVAAPEDASLQNYLERITAIADPIVRAGLPADGNFSYGGSASKLDQAILTMGSNFALALFILFVLMAALFRSIRDSALVMLAIPLATVGGVGLIRLLDLISFQPMDLLTMIGFVILLGLVVNNAILLVHQARRAEDEGLERRSAVRQAIAIRVRPIAMSSLTSLVGMMPLLLSPGAGSIVYRGLAAAIVGGMAVSMIFTLLLLPALLRLGETRGQPATPQLEEAYAD